MLIFFICWGYDIENDKTEWNLLNLDIKFIILKRLKILKLFILFLKLQNLISEI